MKRNPASYDGLMIIEHDPSQIYATSSTGIPDKELITFPDAINICKAKIKEWKDRLKKLNKLGSTVKITHAKAECENCGYSHNITDFEEGVLFVPSCKQCGAEVLDIKLIWVMEKYKVEDKQ